MNLTTFRVWCYACEKEVFLDQRLATHTQSPPVKFTDPVGLSQHARVELLAAFSFTCCKMNQVFSAVVEAFVVIGTLLLKAATCSQRSSSSISQQEDFQMT